MHTTEPKRPIRVLLVDDHGVLRSGLRALLEMEPDMEVVGEASTGEEAIERVRECAPDVALMDLTMPGMGGIEATRRIVALDVGIRILVLTCHDEGELLIPVLRAGGSGYVSKTSTEDELIGAVRTVAAGSAFVDTTGMQMLVAGLQEPEHEEAVDDSLSRLSLREREVLQYTVQGFSAREIALDLGISPKTVDTYRQRVMEKLDVHHRSELVHFALRTGMLGAEVA